MEGEVIVCPGRTLKFTLESGWGKMHSAAPTRHVQVPLIVIDTQKVSHKCSKFASPKHHGTTVPVRFGVVQYEKVVLALLFPTFWYVWQPIEINRLSKPERTGTSIF